MAVGKNKKLGKARKGGRKKAADPFAKKEWYDIRAPTCFPIVADTKATNRSAGKTIATKTQGTKVARDTLVGRVVELSLGDLKADTEEEAFRKFKLRVEDVNGFNCLTQFHGMALTTDKLRSLVRKNQSLIEAYVDVRTSDGYAVRLFAIGFTKKHRDHVKNTAYASAAQTRAIRKKMKEIIAKETTALDLQQLVEKLMLETIGKEIEKHTQAIYPLKDCLIRKAKMLRTPKADVSKLVEAAGGQQLLSSATGHVPLGVKPSNAVSGEDTGMKVDPEAAPAAAAEKAKAAAPAKKAAAAPKAAEKAEKADA